MTRTTRRQKIAAAVRRCYARDRCCCCHDRESHWDGRNGSTTACAECRCTAYAPSGGGRR